MADTKKTTETKKEEQAKSNQIDCPNGPREPWEIKRDMLRKKWGKHTPAIG